MKKIKIRIQNFDDRNNVIVALANNGYAPVIEIKKHLTNGDDYYVIFEIK